MARRDPPSPQRTQSSAGTNKNHKSLLFSHVTSHFLYSITMMLTVTRCATSRLLALSLFVVSCAWAFTTTIPSSLLDRTATAFDGMAFKSTRTTTTTSAHIRNNRWRRSVVSELSNNDIMWIEDDGDAKASRAIDDGDMFDDDDNNDDDDDQPSEPSPKKLSRWDRLNPTIKARLVKAGQERAIANKKKREPAQAKKRRVMMYYKEQQREKKRAARVQRPLGFDDRTPLSALIEGMEMSGVVISLTNFGAYVDVGTECDGLLHVSQISRTTFVEHPRQMLSPGDEVTVRVRSTNPEKKKLHLTMLPKEVLEAEKEDDPADRIMLEDIQADDELWGHIKRVTDYGAYVEVGAAVDGFLHFMDHPAYGWSRGAHPCQFMNVNDRVRVWVSDVDTQQKRIKLTAVRPTHLPGPRREL